MHAPLSTPRRGVTRQPLVLGAILVLVSYGPLTHAKPKLRDAFFLEYPSAVGTVLDDQVPSSSRSPHCGVCHYNFNGGGNRNPYGAAMEANLGLGDRAALRAIESMDADGDGYGSAEEILDTVAFDNTPTFPGLTAGNLDLVIGVGDRSEIQGRLTPASGEDTTPPAITALQPNGGEIIIANSATTITWTATDESGVAGVHLYLTLDNGLSYQLLARGLANTGSYTWFPANRPSAEARIQIVAVDSLANRATNQSAGAFEIGSPAGGRVPTTLRDFDLPGSQPLELTAHLANPLNCGSCHGHYDPNTEPYFTWQGSMMAQASIDPLFEANTIIANQDAPDSGDLCLRCHIYNGWVQGRSVPTDGQAMLPEDLVGVSCDLCHRLLDPDYKAGLSPGVDAQILAGLSFPTTEIGNGMLTVDPDATRRGPLADAASAHPVLVSPFHREAALCGTCHDVSNPAFEKDADGRYVPNAMDAPAIEFSAQTLGPVERTYSEWLFSEFNTPEGVYLPQFAGNKADGRVATCQDCHMVDVWGFGCNPSIFPNVPERPDLPLHDLTGSSTWLPPLLAQRYPGAVNQTAVEAGVARATALLQKAAALAVTADGAQLRVTVTNNGGHKLPTGYPEGRRMWLNVTFYDANDQLLAESGAYDSDTGVLAHDAEAKIYGVHPGLDPDLADLLGLPAGPSFHFVLNNQIYEDNRIPPRGFSNETFASFGGAPVGHTYADGQYWDETLYTLPNGAAKAVVRLYFQSISKEFIEFLREENHTNTKGEEIYALWRDNDKCPPTLMAEATWQPFAFTIDGINVTPENTVEIRFTGRPGTTYTIEYCDTLERTPVWQSFLANGDQTPEVPEVVFLDDYTPNTSGTRPSTGTRFYRFRFDTAP